MRWHRYLCRAGSAHNSVEAAWIAAAMTVASIGPSRSAKAAMVRWPKRNEDRVVEIE
jgi:hypothetical protein